METHPSYWPWRLSERQIKAHDKAVLQANLETFRRVCSGNFYIVDFYAQKVIYDSPTSAILGGYPAELAEQEGLAFFERILTPETLAWVQQMHQDVLEIWARRSAEIRTNFVVTFDLEIHTASGEIQFLHHRVTPYALCRNGNLWQHLCHTTISALDKMSSEASFINSLTGECYTYQNRHFKISDPLHYPEDEIQLLHGILKGQNDQQSAQQFMLSLSSFKAKKRYLFSKLEANNAAAAIDQARKLGVI